VLVDKSRWDVKRVVRIRLGVGIVFDMRGDVVSF
jgi:hypothetical protein